MVQITLIEEADKYEKIQNVNPNVIQNRPDLLGELHFQLLCLKHKPDWREVYIPFKIEGGVSTLQLHDGYRKKPLRCCYGFSYQKVQSFSVFSLDFS